LRGEAITSLRERMDLLTRLGLLEQEPPLQDGIFEQALCDLCRDRTDLNGVGDVAVAEQVLNSSTPATSRAVREWTPIAYRLPGGRCVKVHYEPGREPWIESRLQDFFGLAETPSIAERRQPLTLHLLAPNHRAVQVTQDLSGFWERHYPAIRRELMRRYPRHQWPEDGRSAKPPEARSGTRR
jgi:ATP-dependent helicase HrpB